MRDRGIIICRIRQGARICYAYHLPFIYHNRESGRADSVLVARHYRGRRFHGDYNVAGFYRRAVCGAAGFFDHIGRGRAERVVCTAAVVCTDERAAEGMNPRTGI